jgi:hypothetical protein
MPAAARQGGCETPRLVELGGDVDLDVGRVELVPRQGVAIASTRGSARSSYHALDDVDLDVGRVELATPSTRGGASWPTLGQ